MRAIDVQYAAAYATILALSAKDIRKHFLHHAASVPGSLAHRLLLFRPNVRLKFFENCFDVILAIASRAVPLAKN